MVNSAPSVNLLPMLSALIILEKTLFKSSLEESPVVEVSMI